MAKPGQIRKSEDVLNSMTFSEIRWQRVSVATLWPPEPFLFGQPGGTRRTTEKVPA
jgi:hypothetical protein